MEEIIALSIIAILLIVTIIGAILLRRRFVRSREKKLTQIKEQWEQAESQERQRFKKQTELLAQARSEEEIQLRDRAERLRIKGMQNVTPTYPNLGNAGAQRYDTKTGTIQTVVYDNKTNNTQWRTIGGSGGTTSAQPVTNSSTDLFTGMAIGSLVNSLFSTPSYSRPSSDDSDSQKSVSSSSSSSSWSDSSDSGPSSDW
jgi:hypothetical protein